MCGFKLITSCPEYVHRLPGSGVGLLVGSLCPLTEEIGHTASAKTKLAPSCLVTISARLYPERKILLRVRGSRGAQAVHSISPLASAEGERV